MKSEAEARHERFLWGEPMEGVSFGTPVIAVVSTDFDELVPKSLDESTARKDDAFWAQHMRLPFSWQRFLNWWVARRWVRPRDITKE